MSRFLNILNFKKFIKELDYKFDDLIIDSKEIAQECEKGSENCKNGMKQVRLEMNLVTAIFFPAQLTILSVCESNFKILLLVVIMLFYWVSMLFLENRFLEIEKRNDKLISKINNWKLEQYFSELKVYLEKKEESSNE